MRKLNSNLISLGICFLKLVRPGITLISFIFLMNIICSCQTGPYEYNIPVKLDDGWETSSLRIEGINTKKIEQITYEIFNESKFESILSMLIIKNGKLVHEAYSPFCQRNTLHVLASITKCFTSTLIGIAIDKDFIESADSKVVNLLPEFANYFKDPKKMEITLKHLMTMFSGLEWSERYSYNDIRNSEFQMVESQDWMEYVVSRDQQYTPGTHFVYNTGGIHLLSAVIKSTTGLYAHEFAEKYLLHPMGVMAYQWNRDPMGYPCTGGTDGGLGLRTRDIAKFGWLFYKDGTWKGKRIISEKWIKEATQNHHEYPNRKNGYGYNWTPGSMEISGETIKFIASFGYGGQTLYLVPDLDVIIVFTCDLAEGNANVHIPVRKTFEAIVGSSK